MYFCRTSVFIGLCLVSLAVSKECTTCCKSRREERSRFSGSSPSIDYVQLAVQSAKGFCEINGCDNSYSGWSIHGLWPSEKGSMGPNSCNSTASFDPSLMTNEVLKEMTKEWPTLFGGDPTDFWCHEWCKHGTCAMAGLDPIVSMISYFQSALQLFDATDMNSVFEQNNIISSTSTTYKLSDFQNLFSPSPAFECTNYKDGEGQLLYSARFCYTTDLQPAECNMDWFVTLKACKEDTPIYYL